MWTACRRALIVSDAIQFLWQFVCLFSPYQKFVISFSHGPTLGGIPRSFKTAMMSDRRGMRPRFIVAPLFHAEGCWVILLEKGITACGHSFHVHCWQQLTASSNQPCPVCRQGTTFQREQLNGFSPEPSAVIHGNGPRQQRPYRFILGGSDTRVARYMFQINGHWVDESSPLNTIP